MGAWRPYFKCLAAYLTQEHVFVCHTSIEEAWTFGCRDANFVRIYSGSNPKKKATCQGSGLMLTNIEVPEPPPKYSCFVEYQQKDFRNQFNIFIHMDELHQQQSTH
ncbi:hypothetical protein NL676_011028 [Syzygium grande]|nr:hypothetical protein NL676_011028 [Syzygium grande]